MAKTVRVYDLMPGMVIAQNIYSKSLELLIEKNTTLTNELIQRLDNWRVNQVAIVSGDEKAAAPAPPAPQLTHLTAASETTAVAKQYSTDLRQGEAIRRESMAITHQIIDNVQSERSINRGMTRSIIDKMIGETVGNQRILTTLLSVKNFDNYLFNHLLNVSALAIVTGQCLELTQKEIYFLGEAALLHDIGMTVVPQEIWNKPEPLTEAERFQIQKHPIHAADLLEKMADVEPDIRRAVYQHHEREDGSGYPKGLTGERICLFAKIIAITDCYDAMVNPRRYRSGKLPLHAMRELLQLSATQLNREIMKTFVSQMSLYPIGSVVRLNTRETGIVVTANERAPMRPTLKVMRDASGRILATPLYLDLRKAKKVFITDNIVDQASIDALLQGS